MPNHNDIRAEEASEHWREGRLLEAGTLLYESLPRDVRPRWAYRVLKLAVEKSDVRCPRIEYLLHIANDSTEWENAHRAFDLLRDSSLELLALKSRTHDQQLLLSLLSVAELVAKVIYNATDPSDPFDEDAGCWMAVCLNHVLDVLNDHDFSQAAWLALCCQES
jgi:hypothetical protein